MENKYNNSVVYKIISKDLDIGCIYVDSTTSFTNRRYNY